MNNILIVIIWLTITIIIYYYSRKLYQRVRSPFLLPVLISTVVIILFLLILNVPYDTYMLGGKWISKLLGPAVVALAYPLYEHWKTLKRITMPILMGTLIGAILGVTSGIILAKAAGFENFIIAALSPKSVTTPVAMAITESLGAPASLATVFVMIAGIGGVIMSPFILKLFRLDDPIGRGVGLGCASHALGIDASMENSPFEGSISSIAMIISAIVVSIITPGLIALLV